MIIDPGKYTAEKAYQVDGKKSAQAGYDITIFNCPRCGCQQGMAGHDAGKTLCRCGLWLDVQPQ